MKTVRRRCKIVSDQRIVSDSVNCKNCCPLSETFHCIVYIYKNYTREITIFLASYYKNEKKFFNEQTSRHAAVKESYIIQLE